MGWFRQNMRGSARRSWMWTRCYHPLRWRSWKNNEKKVFFPYNVKWLMLKVFKTLIWFSNTTVVGRNIFLYVSQNFGFACGANSHWEQEPVQGRHPSCKLYLIRCESACLQGILKRVPLRYVLLGWGQPWPTSAMPSTSPRGPQVYVKAYARPFVVSWQFLLILVQESYDEWT